MKLFTKDIYQTLIRNGQQQQQAQLNDHSIDFAPVVKLFTRDANCTWLLTEIDPDDPDIAFGLCDLGMGCPELGSVSISELKSVRGAFGLPVERDRFFSADHPLSVYADAARSAGGITQDKAALDQAAPNVSPSQAIH